MFCCVFSIDLWTPTYSAVEVPCGDNTADGSAGSSSPGTSPTPSSTNNNNTGSGGSGTSGTPVILTSPTPCNVCPVIEEVEESIPCDKLKKILEVNIANAPAGTISIKNALLDLKDNVEGAIQEEGYNFVYNIPTNSYYATPAQQTEENMVQYRYNAITFGGGHFHQPVLQPMFSHDDIATLVTFASNFNIPSSQTNVNYQMPMHLLVTSTGTYAIVVENQELFREQILEIYGDKKKKRKFKDNLERKYSKFFTPFTSSWSQNSTDYEEAFLKFITNADNLSYNLGINLYKAKSDLSGWQKLELEQIGNNYNVKPIDCN